MEPPGNSGKTVVIKVGTSSLVRAEHNTLNLSNMASICETVRTLRAEGYKVVIVSSGAIGVGCQRLKLSARPKTTAQKQALAAMGQVYLIRYYEDFLDALGLVLLTLDNLANRNQYLNARNTFTELFNYGAVPVVNENDTVAVEELLARFGDNDTLSAQVATLVGASWLFLLTDVAALYSANPSMDPSAEPIREVHDIMQLQAVRVGCAVQADVSSKGTQWGTGGMATKLTAARIATAAGCHTVICQTSQPQTIHRILHGARDVGTVFHPHPRLNRGRKRWIPAVPVKGQLWLDAGAQRAVLDRSRSLFSAGILQVAGAFSAQDAVSLCTAEGAEFARGLCNYAHDEVDRIKGMSSKDFMEELGYLGPVEIIHRDNMSMLVLGERSRQIVASAQAAAAAGGDPSADSMQQPMQAAGESAAASSQLPAHANAVAASGHAEPRSQAAALQEAAPASTSKRSELAHTPDLAHAAVPGGLDGANVNLGAVVLEHSRQAAQPSGQAHALHGSHAPAVQQRSSVAAARPGQVQPARLPGRGEPAAAHFQEEEDVLARLQVLRERAAARGEPAESQIREAEVAARLQLLRERAGAAIEEPAETGIMEADILEQLQLPRDRAAASGERGELDATNNTHKDGDMARLQLLRERLAASNSADVYQDPVHSVQRSWEDEWAAAVAEGRADDEQSHMQTLPGDVDLHADITEKGWLPT